MSEYEDPTLLDPSHRVTVDDVRALSGAATPHFANHLRNRLARLVAGLDQSDPARQLAEVEMARLERLATEGERGGDRPGLARLNGAD